MTLQRRLSWVQLLLYNFFDNCPLQAFKYAFFSDTHQKSNSLKTWNSQVLYAIILIVLQNGRKAEFQSVSLVMMMRKEKKIGFIF